MGQDLLQSRTEAVESIPEGCLTNHVELEGTLAKPCDLRYTPTGIAVATLELDHVSNHPDTAPLKRMELKIVVIAFDSLADQCAVLVAGTRLKFRGRLNQKRWIRDERIRWGQVELIATAMETMGQGTNVQQL
ncbi:MAG: single-stranded DNA-binding protein [Magnetococcales bacterium]|nr:single-stranded DNA-binding protein [Magnetococcales bacterium]